MADFSEVRITIDLSFKTATVLFRPANFAPGPTVMITEVPWDTPDDQTESRIKALVIENARRLLKDI
jgi:hypothetical protein